MRVAPLILVMLVLAAAAASAAPADGHFAPARLTAQSPTQTPGERSAQLEVQGEGRIQLHGRLVVYGRVGYADLIQVRDRRGDARLFAEGRQYSLRRGRASIRRVKGRFFVQGRNIQVRVKARDMSVALAGKGKARLQGDGTFRLNGGATLPWINRWITVRPGASPPRVSRRPRTRTPPSRNRRAPVQRVSPR